jgi:acetate kinase
VASENTHPIFAQAFANLLAFLGFELDNASNQTSQRSIGLPGSKPILVVPADDKGMIRDLYLEYLG